MRARGVTVGMSSGHFDSREEPFIGSLRERIQQTKAENARTRASTPVPVRPEGPPSEEAMRAMRASRALAEVGAQRRVAHRVWPIVLLLALLALAGWLAVRYNLVTVRALSGWGTVKVT